MPDSIQVREFEIVIDDRNGGKQPAIIVSTMADPSLPQEKQSSLYWRRWNAEIDIRSVKCSLHLDVIRCRTPEMVRKEIWAHILAYNLVRRTIVAAARRHDILPRQISVRGTMQAVESFTPALMAVAGESRIYDAFMASVAAHRVGNRPGRLEPRLKKRRPAWTAYMTKPRNQTHRRLASQVAG